MAENGLTTGQAVEFAELEEVVNEGIEMGSKYLASAAKAMATIRAKRYYLIKYKSFEDYVEKRWNRTRQWAYGIIKAAGVMAEIDKFLPESGDSDSKPQQVSNNFTPAVAAALVAAAPEGERAELFETAVATAPKDAAGKPKVTARHVATVAAHRAAEQHAKAEQVTVPWGVFVESVNACLDKLEDIRDELNELLDGKKGENKNRHAFAHFIPYLGTIGSIDAAIKCVRENLPAAAHADKPYYIPMRSVKMRAEKVGGR